MGMKCPKCGSEQASSTQCAGCGIYVERCQQQKERAAARKRVTVVHGSDEPRFGLGALSVVAILAAAAMYLWTQRKATVEPALAGAPPSAGAYPSPSSADAHAPPSSAGAYASPSSAHASPSAAGAYASLS